MDRRKRSRELSTYTADSGEAQIAFAQFLQRHTQDRGSREPSEVLVSEILSSYLQRLDCTGKDGERAAYAAVPLTKFFTGKTVGEAPALCDDYRIWRKVSASTVRRDLGVLQSAIKSAFNAQIITRSVSITRPPESPPRERWLTRLEAAMLVAGALGFEPIAFDIRTRQPTKWKRVVKPQYHCAIPPRLLPRLMRAKKLEFDIGNVIQWEGKPVADIKTSFNNAASRVYLENVSPHTLKHTAATWLMQSGKDPFKISDFLATSVLTLLKHYGHHNPDHQSEIAEAISERRDRFRIISG